MTPISVVVITKNEAENIARCIRSVQEIADEIIIVDAHSTDDTVAICKSLGATVISRNWEGYAQNKNIGNAQAKHDFILSMDADEALSDELISEIRQVKQQLRGVYSFNRLTNYCSTWIRHSGWYPDTKTRLFDRRIARWQGDFVHETLTFPAETPQTHLRGDLLHYSYHSISDHVHRQDRYSELAAQELQNKNYNGSIKKLLFGPVGRFLKSYVVKKGYRDGFYGFIICSMAAFYVFLREAKAMHLAKQREISMDK
ncbi:MAG: glycosyltransferase family 2 protein [Calditrichaeota bacterium]|nr:glycosyltransferase family 2 protein [Calditrichota bacterium]MCB0267990.1 glycosyltransferase family 2 protein [Calditrichota bacterium]